MKIRVDFYKPSGKWYTGGLVEIGDAKLWDKNFLDIVWENQDHLQKNYRDYWTIVINDDPEEEKKETYHDFFNAVLQVGKDE